MPADQSRIATEPLLPESVADHHHGRNSALKIRAPNIAAQFWRHAQQWEELCTDLCPFDMLGHVAPGQVRIPAATAAI